MPPSLCARCLTSRAHVKRPKNHQKLCKDCFINVFEEEIHHTITSSKLFYPGEKVALGASGGKDSTVLASVMKTLNERYNYGLDLVLLSIDEGITGYRDDSLETVKQNAIDYDMPLKIVSYSELYGWTMDQVVETIGKKGNCTYCGVFRRQALDRGAKLLGIKHLLTGHNADDIAETVLMNLLRGDLPRLARSTSIVTGDGSGDVKRSKPLKYSYEKEIVLYAHHKKLLYFSTECIYSPEAFRGTARSLIKNLERVRPTAILDIVRSGEDMARLVPGSSESSCACETLPEAITGSGKGCGGGNGADADEGTVSKAAGSHHHAMEIEITSRPKNPQQPASNGDKPRSNIKTGGALQKRGTCKICGYMSSQDICQACMLLEGLNKNRPEVEINAT
ncbi:probable NCS6 Protein with role in invasive growth [Cephalotrichum gorgonifer]|uniref:Cytoplasmic tRNA 2-thiolation protein 1 n=1 Tax=Cephalotrichum gorgonifer TaxID=2041049 RepID=A0AAE8SR72_9PEZI|nr:probable NCS6 Protein with role in invasive growth [Cephalotrichum gorgonifer]